MNDVPVANMITTEELLAMPEDGVDRDLIRGELREKPMTREKSAAQRRDCQRRLFVRSMEKIAIETAR